jgi:hypothetical protein
MTMFEQRSLLQKMDRLVRWTGIPAVSQRGVVEPRRLRWWPLVPLAIGFGLFFGLILRRDPAPWAVSSLSVLTVFTLSLSFCGPMRPPPAQRPGFDERESALRRNSYLAGFIAVAIGSLFSFLLLMGLLMLSDWPRLSLFMQCGALITLLLQLFITVPTLHASWMMPPPLSEEKA